MENTNNSLALIVGGSSGMGLATAKLLLERGIRTVIVGSSPLKLAAAKQHLAGIGNIETIQTNLYEANDVQRIINYVANHDSHINIL